MTRHRVCRSRKMLCAVATVVLLVVLGAGCEKISLMLDPPDLGEETMDRNTVWKERKSPYRITETFTILADATLTIEPGVEVLLGPDVTIHCYGRIVAEGTEEKPIRFGPLEGGGPWDKIDCFGGKTSAEGEVLPDIFRHCIIEGGRGLKARDADLLVEYCKLRNMVDTPISLEFSSGRIARNEIYDNSTEPEDASGNGGGMVVYSDREVVVEENDVHDNVSDGGRDGGGGIYAYAYDKGRVSILNNRIWRNRSDRYGGGLVSFECRVAGNWIVDNVAEDSGGGIFALGGTVERNRIERNRAGRGGGLYTEASLLRNNSIANNTAEPFMGGGLFYYSDGKVEENTFYRNGAEGEAPGDSIVVSGGPVLRRNNIAAGAGYALRVQTHSLAPDLDAAENFWGSRDPEVVIARIYDWLDDAERGLVDWRNPKVRWCPEAPPPPPDFLTYRADGEEWILCWTYPRDVPVSGFRVYWAGETGFPMTGGQRVDGEQRSLRLGDPPNPEAAFFCLSAFREGEEGEVLESAVSRLIPAPAGRAGGSAPAGSRSAGIRPAEPGRCDAPLEKVSLLRVDPAVEGEARVRARWVISELPVDFSTPLFDSGPVEGDESFPVPDGLLQPGREYAWRVAFQGADGSWTDWSSVTRFCTPQAAPEVVRGPLREDRVLGRPSGMTCRVTGNVFVPKGVTVEVLPGTKMEIAPEVNFRVRGKWIARGEKVRPVVFTGDPESPWGHLFFDGEELPAQGSEGEEERGDESAVLQHCVIEHGQGVLIEEAKSLVSDCVIRKNRASGIAVRNAAARIRNNRILENRSPSNGGGIYAYGSRLIYIMDNEIRNNTADEDGGGVFGYGYRSNTAVNLSGNRIEGNASGGDGGGVWLSRSALVENRILANRAEGKGGGLFATFALIENNEVARNSAGEGGGVYAETNSSLQGNRITDNRCRGAYGGGVYMNFWGMSIKNEVFRGNLVSRNAAATQADNGGVYLNGSMIFEYNQIFGNEGSQLYNANPADRPPLTAPHCYWGTTRPEAIEASIHHASDDPRLARVLFKPFAATPAKAKPLPHSREGGNP